MVLLVGSGLLCLLGGLGTLTALGGVHLLAPRKGYYTRPLHFDYAPDDRSYASVFPCECRPTPTAAPPPPGPSQALVPPKICSPGCEGPVVDTDSGPVALAFFLPAKHVDGGGRVHPGTPATAGFLKAHRAFHVDIELSVPEHPYNVDIFTVHVRLLTANGTEVHVQSKSAMRPPSPSFLGALARLPRRVAVAPFVAVGLVTPADVLRCGAVQCSAVGWRAEFFFSFR